MPISIPELDDEDNPPRYKVVKLLELTGESLSEAAGDEYCVITITPALDGSCYMVALEHFGMMDGLLLTSEALDDEDEFGFDTDEPIKKGH